MKDDVMINIAKKDMVGGERMTGAGHMRLLMTNNHVIINADDKNMHRVQDARVHSMVHSKSFSVTTEDMAGYLVEMTEQDREWWLEYGIGLAEQHQSTQRKKAK